MIIACLSMLTDYVGLVFFPKCQMLRIVGRLAMPIYAYFIATGFTNTKDKRKYLKRILLNALISQIPFMVMTNSHKLNICTVWVISIIMLHCINDKKRLASHRIAIFLLCTAVCIGVPMDYGLYAASWVMIFWLREKHNGFAGNITAVVLGFAATAILHNASQVIAIFSIPLIILCEKYKATRIDNRYFKFIYRWFYPLHMMIVDIAAILI